MFGHLIAFKNFRPTEGLWGSEWVGFKHFYFFFLNDYWITVTWNTLYLNFLNIFFGTIFAIITAVFLNEIRFVLFKKISQSFIFLPFFLSWVVVAYMVFALLSTRDGLINNVLTQLGTDGVSWYASPQYWPAIITTIQVWKGVGAGAIIYLAAMSGISGEYYESARIDGANRLKQIWFITLPLLRPTVIMLTLLAVGGIFYGDFGLIYSIVGENALLFPTTDVIDTYVYRGLRSNFSSSAAIVLWQSCMGLICICTVNWMTRKLDKDSSLW
ncbi:sugar ABC transporter permease [Paenibacillus montanisoli]|uniref:Sugar ABC transporter permease n=2 Tax=Paenibacillus montanisoli TaxID=2081970 RepID=A0A328UEB0_9BACL|nr:sugar ABC transporter permease [Paenibacillus montanisoli]